MADSVDILELLERARRFAAKHGKSEALPINRDELMALIDLGVEELDETHSYTSHTYVTRVVVCGLAFENHGRTVPDPKPGSLSKPGRYGI